MFLFTCGWLPLFLALTVLNNPLLGIKIATEDAKCERGTRGQYKSLLNRENDQKIVVCVKSKRDGLYRWHFIDGSETLGEIFDPAKDCSDIVDHVPDAKDGFYWIQLGSDKMQKAWCDVITDGGGFILIGMKNSSVTWNVPFNGKIVHPNGPPHWSNKFGNFEVLDFAVQISTNKNFEATRAHWFYRLNKKRALAKLFGYGKNVCTDVHSGIGNIEFVKDVRTQAVVTRTFNCSKFGPHVNGALGWGRMNYCFNNSCPNGFAYYTGLPTRFDDFGSFSYSTNSAFSGVTHDSTAFVGCDNKKCCACYGPKGGRGNYCGPACTKRNGGVVTKNAYVWFWIRTRQPKRVWRRCMEFKVKQKSGEIETYHIDRLTGISHKGICSTKMDTLLNEATLTVPNKEKQDNIPPIPGLVLYRKDNNNLYVNNGTTWKTLSNQKQVNDLEERLKKLENNINDLRTKTPGVVYTRWGRKDCPGSSKLVYAGGVGGSYYTVSGGGGNYVCLPSQPIYNKVKPGVQGASAMYGSEYEHSGINNIFPSSRHHNNVPCAVCEADFRSRKLMIPARNVCPSGWTMEYNGYLMADHTSHKRTEYVCVDGNPSPLLKGTRGSHGALLYFVQGRCGSLPCGPYVEGYELTCAVCTK